MAKAMHTETHCAQGHPWTEESLYIHPTTGQKNCRICGREYSKTARRKRSRAEWYVNGGKDRMNDARRSRQYGLTPEEWRAMEEEQEGMCAIPSCRRRPPEGKTLNTDHCHETGRVRRLLCHQCNTVLGLVKDSPEVLRDLALYLDEFRA